MAQTTEYIFPSPQDRWAILQRFNRPVVPRDIVLRVLGWQAAIRVAGQRQDIPKDSKSRHLLSFAHVGWGEKCYIKSKSTNGTTNDIQRIGKQFQRFRILQLLQKACAMRLSLIEVMQHPWVKENMKEDKAK